jgi:hypothetical protein
MLPRQGAESRGGLGPNLADVNTALSVLALLIALIALALELSARVRSRKRDPGDVSDLPEDALGLRHEVAALRAEAATSLKNLAVVRYDAFADTGGQLSWSLAVLDDHGNGAVLTSIHGRTEARAYAKTIERWTCAQSLSAEETEAVSRAKS